jgi:hypothetical protein
MLEKSMLYRLQSRASMFFSLPIQIFDCPIVGFLSPITDSPIVVQVNGPIIDIPIVL